MTILSIDLTGVSGSHSWIDPDRPPGPLPSRRYMETCIALVQDDPALCRALRRERGLNRKVASRYGIGYDPDRRAWVLPVLNADGFLVNVIWRPRRGKSMLWHGGEVRRPRRIYGRTANRGMLPLWPHVPQVGPLLLCGGEWDALSARQHGLASAVTGLLGVQWHPAWNDAVVGRRVAVCLDVGEEDAAEITVRRLLSAGARHAWAVHLPLPNYGDDLELWFRGRKYGGYGRGATELLELIIEARAT